MFRRHIHAYLHIIAVDIGSAMLVCLLNIRTSACVVGYVFVCGCVCMYVMVLLLIVAQVHDDERKAVQQALRSLGEQLSSANLSREQEVAYF